MKLNLIISFCIIAFIFSKTTNSFSQSDEKKEAAYINFEKTLHDYGNIPLNGDGSYVFIFENTGNTPLILTNAQSSCGCTVPQWPRDPIAPKGKGEIQVKYNTNRAGSFQKTVTIHSNAENSPTVLTIKGNVERATVEPTLPVKERNILNND